MSSLNLGGENNVSSLNNFILQKSNMKPKAKTSSFPPSNLACTTIVNKKKSVCLFFLLKAY